MTSISTHHDRMTSVIEASEYNGIWHVNTISCNKWYGKKYDRNYKNLIIALFYAGV